MTVEAPETPGPTASTEPLLSLRGVQKSFGAVHVLRGVDLDVHPGQVTALVGDNGAGKSTLIKGIAGIHAFDEGEYEFEGKPVTRARPQGRQRPRHRDRLPGPGPVRQPRRRRQHVPRPRDQEGRPGRRQHHGAARPRDPRRALRAHPEVGAHPRGRAVRWPAPDRRHRARRAVELQGRHPRRAHRRTRCRPDRAGAAAGTPSRRPWPRRRADQPQPGRRLPGRRQHRGPLPRSAGRPGAHART